MLGKKPRNNSYAILTFSCRFISSQGMRTNSEQMSEKIRRVGLRFRRLARRAVQCVRNVLKRVQGGVGIPRHMEEASICPPAITARCHTEKAEIKRGLPGGKQKRVPRTAPPLPAFQISIIRQNRALSPFMSNVLDDRRALTGPRPVRGVCSRL